MYHLYILKCADKTLYTGITVDLDRRIKEHNTSHLGARYTSSRRPVKLVYSKKFRNRSLASKEENRIKHLPRKDKLVLINKKSIIESSLTPLKMAKGNDKQRREKKKINKKGRDAGWPSFTYTNFQKLILEKAKKMQK